MQWKIKQMKVNRGRGKDDYGGSIKCAQVLFPLPACTLGRTTLMMLCCLSAAQVCQPPLTWPTSLVAGGSPLLSILPTLLSNQGLCKQVNNLNTLLLCLFPFVPLTRLPFPLFTYIRLPSVFVPFTISFSFPSFFLTIFPFICGFLPCRSSHSFSSSVSLISEQKQFS